ncbi:alpha/beta fold hydrolase [Fictibacillus aquaticus]|uniref:Alpha/beta hydrolase n=1 Tax=Fictibacillus aquaticus TaxID=2021314 RepID=A0A235F5R2_9BACL|nr:alpha/beta hydrolase [Fictibacillus aquaticus]OYD56579.1 alpha/beta hydrolase [Fictibacillus aquaticus]
MEFSIGNDTLYYEMEGHGHPLIILHSMGTDHRSMRAWIEPIFEPSEDVQRIYVDIPAHGRSVCSDVRSTEDMVRLLREFVETAIPDGQFSLVGHSYGGYIAQGIFNELAHRVRGICLLASALHKKERTLPEKVVRERDEAALRAVDQEIRQAFETLLVYQNYNNLVAFIDELQPGRMLADRTFLLSNWRENGYFLPEDPLSAETYSQQALIIAGKQDAITGYKDYYPLAEKFPNSTLAVLNEAGHLMTVEKRRIVQTLFRDWLESCARVTLSGTK